MITLELGAPADGEYDVKVGWLADPGAPLEVTIAGQHYPAVHVAPNCETTDLGVIHLSTTNRVTLSTPADAIVDYLELTPANAKYR